MSNSKKFPQKITIGTKDSDKDLIEKIVSYQYENNIRYSADAVRRLCEDALIIKKAMK